MIGRKNEGRKLPQKLLDPLAHIVKSGSILNSCSPKPTMFFTVKQNVNLSDLSTYQTYLLIRLIRLTYLSTSQFYQLIILIQVSYLPTYQVIRVTNLSTYPTYQLFRLIQLPKICNYDKYDDTISMIH